MAMAARGFSDIGCDKFKSGVDDFDEWVELFEKAVKLATKQSGDELKTSKLDWLPLKLDRTARSILNQCKPPITDPPTPPYTWDELKDKLKDLLIDPMEKYKWQAKKTKLKWDGIESFDVLASRVTRTVNKYDKDLPDDSKEREYFFRFREALPRDYQKAVDMGCSEHTRTLDKSKDIANRMRFAKTSEEDDSGKVVARAMRDGGMSALEKDMDSMFKTVKGLSDKIKDRNDDHDKETDQWLTALEKEVERLSKRVDKTDFFLRKIKDILEKHQTDNAKETDSSDVNAGNESDGDSSDSSNDSDPPNVANLFD